MRSLLPARPLGIQLVSYLLCLKPQLESILSSPPRHLVSPFSVLPVGTAHSSNVIFGYIAIFLGRLCVALSLELSLFIVIFPEPSTTPGTQRRSGVAQNE